MTTMEAAVKQDIAVYSRDSSPKAGKAAPTGHGEPTAFCCQRPLIRIEGLISSPSSEFSHLFPPTFRGSHSFPTLVLSWAGSSTGAIIQPVTEDLYLL